MLKHSKHHLPKFDPPQTQRIYPRKRLFSLLDNYHDKRMLWLSAPAGSGKTSLVASYLTHKEKQLIWYQVDSGDSDVASFFQHMTMCIKNSYPKKRMARIDFTSEYSAGLRAFSIYFFRELFKKIEPGTVLVLDNYQEVGEVELLSEVMACSINEIPLDMQLIIISRNDPPETFAAIQVFENFSLISMEDVVLSRKESDAIIALRAKHAVPDDQCARLYELTQGWAVGLILMLLQLNKAPDLLMRNKLDDSNILFQYLAGEFLAGFDESSKEVLYKTSPLKRITIANAVKLTGTHACKKIFNELCLNQILTIHKDKKDESFEFHPLFRQYLYQQASKDLDSDKWLNIQVVAAELMIKEGEYNFAAEIYIKINDWVLLANLIKERGPKLILLGQYATLVKWLDEMPDEYILKDVWLQYWDSICVMQKDPVGARNMLEKVHYRFVDQGDVKGVYLSYCNMLESFMQVWDTFKPVENWINRYDVLKNQFSVIPGIELKTRINVSLLGAMTFAWPNHPDIKKYRTRVEIAFRLIPIKQLRAVLGGVLSLHYTSFGDLKGLKYINSVLNDFLDLDSISYVNKVLIYSALIIENLYLCEFEKQEKIIKLGLSVASQTGMIFFNRMYLGHMVNLYLTKNEIPEAEKELNKLKGMGQYEDDVFHGYYLFLRGRLSLEKSEISNAIQYLESSLDVVVRTRFINAYIIVGSFLSVAYAESGQFDKADECMVRVDDTMKMFDDHPYERFGVDAFKSYIFLLKNDHKKAKSHLEAVFSRAEREEVYTSPLWYGRAYNELLVYSIEHRVNVEYACKVIKKNKIAPSYKTDYLGSWPWPVKIYTMGRFGLLVNNVAHEMGGRQIEFIKILLSFGGREVSDSKIIDAMWPDADGDQAQINLKTTIHRIRKSFDLQDVFILKNHKISLNEKLCWVDSWYLNRLLSYIETIPEAILKNELIMLAGRLMKAYKGHYLENDIDAWVIQPRERLRLYFLRQVVTLAQKLEKIDVETSLLCYKRLLEIDPLIESAYQGIIRLYQSQGRHAEVTSTYIQCKELFSKEGLKPSENTNLLAYAKT